MKTKLVELREAVAEKLGQVDALNDAMKPMAVKRSKGEELTDEEVVAFNAKVEERDALDAEINVLRGRVKAEENIQRELALAAKAAGTGTSDAGEKKELSEFSLRRMVLCSNEELRRNAERAGEDFGFEDEMHKESQVEAKRYGLDVEAGSVGVPEKVLRAMAVLEPTDGSKGGKLVETQTDPSIVRLYRNANILKSMGASVKTGLKDNYRIVLEQSVLEARWEGETTQNQLTDKTYTDKTMRPKRLSASTVYSRQLAIQSTLDVETELRQNLFGATDDKLMETLLIGTGVDPIPRGLLASGIPVLALNTDANAGGALTYEAVVALETALNAANVPLENLAYLGNAKVRGKLKTTKVDAGSGQFVMPSSGELNGYRYLATNAVPSNITKGTSGATLSALVFGDMRELEIAQWGGITLVTDIYSQARNAQIVITIDSFWDMLVRRLNAFVAYKDVVA